ncbi:histidine phosphatase family protein [Streptomyces canus]|uniref:histidine phosphatase family protein n=1 Tax=Streptomyces canus TaxID=58343 RepID=UPI0037203C6A
MVEPRGRNQREGDVLVLERAGETDRLRFADRVGGGVEAGDAGRVPVEVYGFGGAGRQVGVAVEAGAPVGVGVRCGEGAGERLGELGLVVEDFDDLLDGHVGGAGLEFGGRRRVVRWGVQCVGALAVGGARSFRHRTDDGPGQAARTADWVQHVGVHAVFSSPLRCARETAWSIASRTGLRVREDARLRERMNWDGSQPMEDLLADWAAPVNDRDFAPTCGDSSRDAAERFRTSLVDLTKGPALLPW